MMPTNDIFAFTKELNTQSKSIQSMLPSGISWRRFMRTVVNTISIHPQVEKLLNADRKSLFLSCQRAAGDGLLIDGRESTLVVFRDRKANRDVVNYIPMVQGLVKLARNSGEIENIVSEVVYEGDHFQYRPGIDDQPIHDPDWFGDRGEPIGVYAIVTLKSSEKIVTVLNSSRIKIIANVGRNADQYNPKKGLHFEEWWKKSAIKNVLKYSPKSSYLESALSLSDTVEDDVNEKDVTPSLEEEIKVKKLVSCILQGIDDAKTDDQLFKLKKDIIQLPIDEQEKIVVDWNEKAMELKKQEQEQEQNKEKKHRPVADSGLAEHQGVIDSEAEQSC